MATKTITGQVQIRNDTAQNWAVENPVLLPGELGLETDTGNGKFGDGETTWNSLKYAFHRNNTRNIEYIVGTQTAATGAWTGVSEDTSLYDGKLILYFLPCAGSGNATLNLTLADGTQTGAIPVFIGASGINGTRMTTQFAVKTQGAPMLLAYDAKNNVWCNMQYWSDANTYDRNLLNDIRVTAGTNKIMKYSLIMQKADGTWESCTTTSGTGTSKTKNTSGFRLGKIWLYNYNETIAANALTRNDYLYDCIPHTLTYSTNCGTTLVAREPVYLVGTIGNDGLFYLDTPWWTQTEPTTEDGKVYIYLGDAYSTSAIYKVANNPIYEYRDGAFRLYAYIPNSQKPVSACVAGDYHAASTVISLTVSLADYNKLHFVCGTDSATEGVQTIEVPLNTGRTYHRLVWFTGDVATNYQWDGIARNAKALTVTINTSTNKVTIVSSNVTSNGIRQIYAE